MAHEHHHHEHNHAHEHAHAINADTQKVYLLCILLNLGFVAIEGIVGLTSGSVGLVSDAGHNLSDVLSLFLALIAFYLSASSAKGRFTFGFRKASVLISLINAILLLVAVAFIAYSSVVKIMHPTAVDGSVISITAGIGIIVNGLTAWLLLRQNQKDVNNRGAYLHMLADTLVSVGVVISGIIINITGWTTIDPIISIFIAGIILVSGIKLFMESLNLSMDAVPESVDLEAAKKQIEACEGVVEAEHIHIWPISTSEVALTAHVVIAEISAAEECIAEIKHELSEIGISHSTIEVGTKHEEITSI